MDDWWRAPPDPGFYERDKSYAGKALKWADDWFDENILGIKHDHSGTPSDPFESRFVKTKKYPTGTWVRHKRSWWRKYVDEPSVRYHHPSMQTLAPAKKRFYGGNYKHHAKVYKPYWRSNIPKYYKITQ